MNNKKNTENEEPQEILVARAAIEYLNKHGLVLTSHFSEENPPSKEVEDFLLSYLAEAEEFYASEAAEFATDIIQSDIDDYIEEDSQEDGGDDELL